MNVDYTRRILIIVNLILILIIRRFSRVIWVIEFCIKFGQQQKCVLSRHVLKMKPVGSSIKTYVTYIVIKKIRQCDLFEEGKGYFRFFRSSTLH